MEEMMDDVLDDEELDEEATSEADKILMEITNDVLKQGGKVPQHAPAVANPAAAVCSISL